MASEAQTKQKLLDAELAKAIPDPDVVYALRQTRPYWNTVDSDSIWRGFEKLKQLNKEHI
jgi:hypothetical protein